MSRGAFQFGEFRLDREAFALSRRGRTLRLERKPLDLLILLVERNGQLVTRTEIAQRLWGTDVFVDTEHGINTAIRKIRQVLSDDSAEPRFVETVTGRGYRFLAQVTVHVEVSPCPALPIPDLAPAPLADEAQSWRPKLLPWIWGAGATLLLAVVAAIAYYVRLRPPEVRYTQLTDLIDSASAPALSPDGQTVAFIRGPEPFGSADPIYAKSLSDSDAHLVVNDPRFKYGTAFSPDGSEILYSVIDPPYFSTYAVPVSGGEPHLFLKNAAAVSWLNDHQLLFSRLRSGLHLGVVTGSVTGADTRDIYFPAHQRGMAHYSYASPDRHWILIVEMTGTGEWGPCRLVPFQGGGSPKLVGPNGACTSAAWSPDGSWMYFTAVVNGQSHIWRQRFPNGLAQQITFGATEEQGLAVERSGQSLITSVGMHESALWIHDENGERPISSEGEIFPYSRAVFRENDRVLYYLLQRRAKNAGAELRRYSVTSGKSEAVYPGVSMLAFDVSPDGKQIVFVTPSTTGKSTELWMAPADGSASPVRLGIRGANVPLFGREGHILFQFSEGDANYLEDAKLDGAGRSKVVPYRIDEVQDISPGRNWVTAMIPDSHSQQDAPVMAIPLGGGPPIRICFSYCVPRWSSDGRFLFVPADMPSQGSAGRSLVIPTGANEAIPDLPALGIQPSADPGVVPGAQSFPRADLIPGRDLSHYAFVKTSVHTNLYRVSLH